MEPQYGFELVHEVKRETPEWRADPFDRHGSHLLGLCL